jgi:toxin CcdB
MPKFDVYRTEGGYLLDIQADFLNYLGTRVVVPLLPTGTTPPPAKGLNPIFRIEDDEVVMATQLLAAVPRSMLKTSVANLSSQHDKIVAAVDFLMQGF